MPRRPERFKRPRARGIGLPYVAIAALLAVRASFAGQVATAVEEAADGAPASGPVVSVHDGVYVGDANQVRRYERSEPSGRPTDIWSTSSPVLALADTPQRGHVFVLDRNRLSLVRFSEDQRPVAIWSYAVDGSSYQAEPGHLLARAGNDLYVADPSIPGIRVISVDAEGKPTTLATYDSPEGAVRDLSLHGSSLQLVTEAGIVEVEVDGTDAPTFHRLGARETAAALAPGPIAVTDPRTSGL